MLEVPTKVLLLVAAVVWLAAGTGVVAVGVGASLSPWTVFMAVACFVVYVLFLVMFLMISSKHIRRIMGYREKSTSIFKFFDAKSYLLILVMMGLGVAIRMSGLVPGSIIAFFYSGLGFALITSAVYYVVVFIATCDELVVGRTAANPDTDGT
jgi:hypothetical protein